jgi:hypothetical protein
MAEAEGRRFFGVASDAPKKAPWDQGLVERWARESWDPANDPARRGRSPSCWGAGEVAVLLVRGSRIRCRCFDLACREPRMAACDRCGSVCHRADRECARSPRRLCCSGLRRTRNEAYRLHHLIAELSRPRRQPPCFPNGLGDCNAVVKGQVCQLAEIVRARESMSARTSATFSAFSTAC